MKKSVVGIEGMDICIEMHISTIKGSTNDNVWFDWEFEDETPASIVRSSTTELSKPINIHGLSRPNYHISPLTKCLPSQKQHNKHIFTFLINREERKYRSKQFYT